MKVQTSDTTKLLEDIRSSVETRELCIRALLNDGKYVGAVQKIVRERGGSDADVTFVLHHTLVAFMKQVLERRDFIIVGTVYSYLNGIAKYLWLGELRKEKQRLGREVSIANDELDYPDEGFELELLAQERRGILREMLQSLGDKCKQVLLLWAAGHEMSEIAQITGYKSAGVARKKKFQCMKALTTYLDGHPSKKEMLK